MQISKKIEMEVKKRVIINEAPIELLISSDSMKKRYKIINYLTTVIGNISMSVDPRKIN